MMKNLYIKLQFHLQHLILTFHHEALEIKNLPVAANNEHLCKNQPQIQKIRFLSVPVVYWNAYFR